MQGVSRKTIKSYKSLKCPHCAHAFVRWMGKVTSGTTTCPKCKWRFPRREGAMDDQSSTQVKKEAASVRKLRRTLIAEGKTWRQSSKEFYASREWQQLRYEALKLHGGRCQCCGASAATGAVLHVDHIKPRYHFPDLELKLSNLQVLCEACNLGKGAWDSTDWRPTEEPSTDVFIETLDRLSPPDLQSAACGSPSAQCQQRATRDPRRILAR